MTGRVLAGGMEAGLSGTSGTPIVTFSLQNTAGTASARQYVQFNQQFAMGALPTDTELTAVVGGVTVAVQMDVQTRYADGSVQSALLTLAEPSIAAGGSLAGTLLAAQLPATTPVATNAALAGGYDLVVNLDIASNGVFRIDAAKALAGAIANNTVDVVRQGPLATEVNFDVDVTRALHLSFNVVTYADGSTATKVWFRNDIAMQDIGGDIQYNSISIVEGGQTKFSRGALTQYQYQTWTQDIYDGASATPTLHVRHDIDYLERIGAILPYDLTAQTDAVGGVPSGWTNVLGVNGVTQFMPMTGGRADIGPTTTVNANWLITQDPAAAKYALMQAQAAGSIPWHYYDAANGHYLSLDDYPSMWIDNRGIVKPTQLAGDAGGWTTDREHAPDMSFVAYLLTGDQYHLDMLNAQASWVLASTWDYPRQLGDGIVVNWDQNVRAQAWSLRVVTEAAYANPDGSYEKEYFSRIADNNWKSLLGQIPNLTAQQGEVHGIIPGYFGTPDIAPAAQDYFASTSAIAALQGNEYAREVLKWQANFLSGRFLSPDIDPHNGYNYILNAMDSQRNWHGTWSEVADATRAAGNYSTTNGLHGFFAELAAMSNAAIISVFSGGDDPTDHRVAADAMRAYGWLLWDNNPDLRSDLQYQLAPRMADGSQIGVTEMRVVTPSSLNATFTFTGANVFGYDHGVGSAKLIGTNGADVLVDASARGGDRLEGRGGDDYLIGGSGTNVFVPGAGNDYVLIRGGAAQIVVDASLTGRLEIEGFRPGTDIIQVSGSFSLSTMLASATADGYGGVLLRASDAMTIRINNLQPGQVGQGMFDVSGAGPISPLFVVGTAAAEHLVGSSLADTINGGGGADTMVGAAGNDLYYVATPSGIIVEVPGGGVDRVLSSVSYGLPAFTENLTLTGTAHISGSGNGAANRIDGNAGNNRLSGFGGADFLAGGGGNDILVGGAGADTMDGGAGDDLFVVDSALDRVVEAAGGGNDRIQSAVTYSLPANVEALILTGAAAINGTGNGSANSLFGNAGANVLSGLAGDDLLAGGAGNDTLFGGIGADVLNGAVGADSMVGGAGNDIYDVDNAGDRVVEAANEGNDVVRASVSFVLPVGVERLLLTGNGAIDGTGNAQANILFGNAAANHLAGAGGNDVLVGGLGADTLTGGAGTDFFRYAAPSQGGDRITDFDPSQDFIQIMRGGFSQDLAAGPLDPSQFVSGTAAVGSGAQFIYDGSAGVLRWDADGAGGQASVVIATLTGAPALSAADISILG
ncbi:calcium-binding protein [Neoroseomonas soli]|uniref:Calcium-binding protein n=1 Tax=Neoroseomonas soli TaxID=1081025 RepID=A0A9X9WSM1_9PROT|nr:calcium-binding protein [Neoroseomonas soli]MBR0670150.1 calcium-binding protein [Neoroseomonas soli]